MTNLQALIDKNKEQERALTQYLATIQVLQERVNDLEESNKAYQIALAEKQIGDDS